MNGTRKRALFKSNASIAKPQLPTLKCQVRISYGNRERLKPNSLQMSYARTIDDCKTNVLLSLFRANFEKCFVSGHDFSRAEKGPVERGL
jgi:hypothetical protein